MKFEFPQISKFTLTLLTLIVLGGIFIVLFYPTESRVAAKWNAKIQVLSTQIEEKRTERIKAREDYLKLDSTLSGAIVDLISQMNRYEECKANLSIWCDENKNVKMIPSVSAAEETNTTWTVTPAITGVPLWTWDQDIQIKKECELWVRGGKVEWIEFHYTASQSWTTLTSIKASHEDKYGIDHIGYHYVIKANGEITSTRDEKCVAAADKWHKNNYRFIQVAFVGDDKPTEAQTKSMVELTKAIQFRYKLPIDSVSSHQEWGPKSEKENLIYWYGSKANFIKKIRESQSITIYGKDIKALSYAWEAWWDIDFIATVWQESRFDWWAIGDGWDAHWFCQINKAQNPGWHREYNAFKTWQERMNYCHELYTYAASLPWWVGSRFHGYNVRKKHIPFISIK